MINIIIIISLLITFMAYLLWTLHSRLEILTASHALLAKKLRDGEHVIIENFDILQKKVTHLEHEIKEIARIEPKVKEANKAISRLQRK